MYEGKTLKQVASFAAKRADISQFEGNEKLIVPAMFTLRRKFLNDDATSFEKAINVIFESLTNEELLSEKLPAIIISKYSDDSEYTEDDAAYFKAFSEAWEDLDLLANIRNVVQKYYPEIQSEESEALHLALLDSIAGMSVKELKSPRFADILAEKGDALFASRTKGSSRRASFHNMKRKASMADNVDHGAAVADVNHRRSSRKIVAHGRQVDPELELEPAWINKRQAESDTYNDLPTDEATTRIMLTLKRKYPGQKFDDIALAVTPIYQRLTSEELSSVKLPATIISRYQDGTFTEDDQKFYEELGQFLKNPEFLTFVNNIAYKYHVHGDLVKSDKLSDALFDVVSSLTIAEMKSSNVTDIMEQRTDDIMNGIDH